MGEKSIFIERRGTPFFEDAFFKDSWDEWDNAMRDAVDRWERHIGDSSRMYSQRAAIPEETASVYRYIRSSNVTSDESMAVKYTEEDEKFKLVMDVKDFKPNEICVKALDTNVIVEGKIESNDGHTTSTRTFVKRFHLPNTVNMSAVSSALSRDGVLTITAPKFILPKGKSTVNKNLPILGGPSTTTVIMEGSGRPHRRIWHYGDAAGKPSDHDSGPFNPLGGSGVSHWSKQKSYGPNVVNETITLREGDAVRDLHEKQDMVNRSQREMENMMRNHTIDSSVKPPGLRDPPPSLNMAPYGSMTSRDVRTNGNTTTERQENRWSDNPAPGLARDNRMYSESSKIRDEYGNVIGNKLRKEQESKAEGSREEVLPDGSTRKTFTKSYETKHSYQAAMGH